MKTVEDYSNNVVLASLSIYLLISMGMMSIHMQPGLITENTFMEIIVIKAKVKNQFGILISGRLIQFSALNPKIIKYHDKFFF